MGLDSILTTQMLDTASQPSTPGYIDPTWAANDPRRAQGQLTRAQWNLFQTKYRPLEDKAINTLLSSSEPAAQAAGAAVQKSYSAMPAEQARTLARYGLSAPADEAKSISRRTDLTRALDVASATNNTRTTVDQQRVTGLEQMLNTMNGVSQDAGQNLDSAASSASQRDIAAKQNAAARNAANQQMLATGLGLAAMALL